MHLYLYCPTISYNPIDSKMAHYDSLPLELKWRILRCLEQLHTKGATKLSFDDYDDRKRQLLEEAEIVDEIEMDRIDQILRDEQVNPRGTAIKRWLKDLGSIRLTSRQNAVDTAPLFAPYLPAVPVMFNEAGVKDLEWFAGSTFAPHIRRLAFADVCLQSDAWKICHKEKDPWYRGKFPDGSYFKMQWLHKIIPAEQEPWKLRWYHDARRRKPWMSALEAKLRTQSELCKIWSRRKLSRREAAATLLSEGNPLAEVFDQIALQLARFTDVRKMGFITIGRQIVYLQDSRTSKTWENPCRYTYDRFFNAQSVKEPLAVSALVNFAKVCGKLAEIAPQVGSKVCWLDLAVTTARIAIPSPEELTGMLRMFPNTRWLNIRSEQPHREDQDWFRAWVKPPVDDRIAGPPATEQFGTALANAVTTSPMRTLMVFAARDDLHRSCTLDAKDVLTIMRAHENTLKRLAVPHQNFHGDGVQLQIEQLKVLPLIDKVKVAFSTLHEQPEESEDADDYLFGGEDRIPIDDKWREYLPRERKVEALVEYCEAIRDGQPDRATELLTKLRKDFIAAANQFHHAQGGRRILPSFKNMAMRIRDSSDELLRRAEPDDLPEMGLFSLSRSGDL